MTGRLSALRARILKAGILAYQYAPMPGYLKDGCVTLAYRIAGGMFRGQRHYELWLRRGSAPLPPMSRYIGGLRRILVVDRYVPQPDRDAGSRSTWCVLRALRQMGLAVTFWPRDMLYDEQYVPMLEVEGIEVLWGESPGGRFERWFARNGSAFDYVLLNRPLTAREYVGTVRRHSHAKVLLYGHDLHHARLAREYALTRAEPLRWEAAIMRRIEQALWRSVDVVYYPSAEETEVVRETVPGVRAHTLPLMFFDDEPWDSAPEGRAGIVFVAGFGHAPNVDAAKWLVTDILPRVRESAGDVHLWLVGSNPTPEVLALASEAVTVTGYVSDADLLAFYRSARVAIVPLRTGAGMKGKVVEALHYGVPLVTTPIGAQGFEGLDRIATVSSDAKELARGVATLLRDDGQWKLTSRCAVEYARSRFSKEAMVSLLALDIEPQQVG